jgi:arylsulfatase A-like enzyme
MKPNLIWIFSDQHRAQAMGCTGDPNARTPNIDRMASGCVTGIGGSPLCSPFRGSVLTSRYPHHCIPGHDLPLPDDAKTIAHAFNDNGYRTSWFGKWHVDGQENRDEETRPAHHHVRRERRGGFDTWIGYENNNAQFDCWVHGHDGAGNEVDLYQLDGYETDKLTDLLLDDLAQHDTEEPFFSVLAFQPPHSPYVAPDAYHEHFSSEQVELRANVPPVERVVDSSRESLAGYYAMIENMDWNIGRVLEAVEAKGVAENTYVIYFSDHGDMHGSQGRILKCVPFEESVRIPFIVRDPKAEAQGSREQRGRSPELINHVDIGPTSLGICGIDKPEWMVGTDYSGCYLDHREEPETMPDSAYLQLVDPGFKYGFAVDRERPWRGVVTDDGWKYAVFEGVPWLMYNLNEDPYEMVNLAMDRRFGDERKRLQGRLARWIEETGDAFVLPEIE